VGFEEVVSKVKCVATTGGGVLMNEYKMLSLLEYVFSTDARKFPEHRGSALSVLVNVELLVLEISTPVYFVLKYSVLTFPTAIVLKYCGKENDERWYGDRF
jgi:hypothetical protein